MRQHLNDRKIFRSSHRPLAPVLIFVGLIALMVGCGPQVGDSCEDDADCQQEGLVCDRSVENGFCTIRDCRPGDCPSESVCVEFDDHTSYCMKNCSSNQQCREDHTCIDDSRAETNYCFTTD